MPSHSRASDERQLQVKTLPQRLRRDSRLAASMPGCDALRRLEAAACDGYRSTCSRPRICDRLPGARLVGLFVFFVDFIFFLSLYSLPVFSTFP